MATRYSRIRQGRELQEALTNYTTYLTTPRTRRLNSRGARGATTPIYVKPFGVDIGATQLAAARNNLEAYGLMQGYVNETSTGGEVANELGANQRANLTQFSPARVVWFRNRTRVVRVATSDITRQEYLKYEGDTSSIGFGRRNIDDDLIDVFNAIKDEIYRANPTFEVNRISLTREKVAL